MQAPLWLRHSRGARPLQQWSSGPTPFSSDAWGTSLRPRGSPSSYHGAHVGPTPSDHGARGPPFSPGRRARHDSKIRPLLSWPHVLATTLALEGRQWGSAIAMCLGAGSVAAPGLWEPTKLDGGLRNGLS